MYESKPSRARVSMVRRTQFPVAICVLFLLYQAANLFTAHDDASVSTTISQSDFPKILWQTEKTQEEADSRWSDKVSSWTDLNPDYQYELLTDESMDDFVQEHFAKSHAILSFWQDLREIPVLRTDLLRYLVMLAVGGTYSDMDTTNYLPISEWVPEHLRDQEINVIAGLEYADHTYRIFSRSVSFCQWTLMAKPGHAIFRAAVQRVIDRLEFISRMRKLEVSQLRLSDLTREDVLEATGPGTFSDSVMEVLKDQTGNPNLQWMDFYGMQEPKVFGDVLVLPINMFGWGQKHSNSSQPGWGELYVRHHFGGKGRWGKGVAPPPKPALVEGTKQALVEGPKQ